MSRRAVRAAILLYVTLDLSLAAMPGAFVFDVAESVESTHGARVRVSSSLESAPVPRASPSALIAPALPLSRPRFETAPTGPVPVLRATAPRRGPADGPAASDDPH